MQGYEARLGIPLKGNTTQKLYTKSGNLVSEGYTRVVIGGRGPYVEFEAEHVVDELLYIPPQERWRLDSSKVYYFELRTNDDSNVKCYFQQKLVDYADYKIGMIYISPFDLYDEDGNVLIEKVRASDGDT